MVVVNRDADHMRVDSRRDYSEHQYENKGWSENDPEAGHSVDRIDRIVPEGAFKSPFVEQATAAQPTVE